MLTSSSEGGPFSRTSSRASPRAAARETLWPHRRTSAPSQARCTRASRPWRPRSKSRSSNSGSSKNSGNSSSFDADWRLQRTEVLQIPRFGMMVDALTLLQKPIIGRLRAPTLTRFHPPRRAHQLALLPIRRRGRLEAIQCQPRTPKGCGRLSKPLWSQVSVEDAWWQCDGMGGRRPLYSDCHVRLTPSSWRRKAETASSGWSCPRSPRYATVATRPRSATFPRRCLAWTRIAPS
mmetsp:Transcript_32739/g.93868  ORF Transcript_32739/g.93868 Transcript_32739/m.93868 type:complete len:235 (-) Transcript_32739:69-773(-)